MKMFEEIFQEVGRYTDLIFVYARQYWYIAIPVLLISFYLFIYLFIRFWGTYMGD